MNDTIIPKRIGKAMHFNEMLHGIAIAEEHRQTVNIRAWKSNGEIVEYNGWVIHHDHWKGGYVRIRNPRNGQIRLLPEIFIIGFMGKNVYL